MKEDRPLPWHRMWDFIGSCARAREQHASPLFGTLNASIPDAMSVQEALEE